MSLDTEFCVSHDGFKVTIELSMMTLKASPPASDSMVVGLVGYHYVLVYASLEPESKILCILG